MYKTFHLTFPLQLIAIVYELKWVGLIRSLDVIDIDVQVVWCFQVFLREHWALAVIQGQVHVGGYQGATLPLGHGLPDIQTAGRIYNTTKV